MRFAVMQGRETNDSENKFLAPLSFTAEMKQGNKRAEDYRRCTSLKKKKKKKSLES